MTLRAQSLGEIFAIGLSSFRVRPKGWKIIFFLKYELPEDCSPSLNCKAKFLWLKMTIGRDIHEHVRVYTYQCQKRPQKIWDQKRLARSCVCNFIWVWLSSLL